jgi:hypothetical protein
MCVADKFAMGYPQIDLSLRGQGVSRRERDKAGRILSDGCETER